MRKALSPENRIFLTVAAGVFMSTMDSSMINVALPTLMEELHSTLAIAEWIILIYLLTVANSLLFWGHLASIKRKEKIYQAGMFIFGLGSLLCAAAPGIVLLICFRFIQGLGAAMMMAVGPALIKAVFPPQQLGRGLGMIGIATSLGLLSGPVISGFVIHYLHWRIIFLMTAPVSFFFFFLGFYHTTSKNNAAKKDGKLPFSATSLLLWIVAISLTVLLTNHATVLCCKQNSTTIMYFLTGLFAAFAAWTALLRHENKSTNPLLPPRLFRKKFFSMAMLSALLSFAVLFFVLLLIPFYLHNILQLPTDKIGLVMMAVPACVFVVSPLAGRLFDRYGAQIIATTGLALCTGSLLFLLLSGLEAGVWQLALGLALLGAGQALFLAPNSAAALKGVSENDAGLTSSLLATSRNLGMLIGTALAGLIFTYTFSRLTGGMELKNFTDAHSPAFMTALKSALLTGIVLASAGVAASWLRGKDRKNCQTEV